MEDKTKQNEAAQMAAQAAIEKQKEDAYQKRLEEKRAARAKVSAI